MELRRKLEGFGPTQLDATGRPGAVDAIQRDPIRAERAIANCIGRRHVALQTPPRQRRPIVERPLFLPLAWPSSRRSRFRPLLPPGGIHLSLPSSHPFGLSRLRPFTLSLYLHPSI